MSEKSIHKKEYLIEADERLTGSLVSALHSALTELFEKGMVKAFKLADLAPISAQTVAERGELSR